MYQEGRKMAKTTRKTTPAKANRTGKAIPNTERDREAPEKPPAAVAAKKKAAVKKKPAAKKSATSAKTVAKKTAATKSRRATGSKTAMKETAPRKTAARAALATQAKVVEARQISADQRHALIAEAAYLHAEAHGFCTDPHADWVRAESEVDTSLARQGVVVRS